MPVSNQVPETDARGGQVDLTRCFLPEALAGAPMARTLDAPDAVRLNQIRAASYLHLFRLLEEVLGAAARARAVDGTEVQEQLAPILRLDAFDHGSLFGAFLADFARVFPVSHRRVGWPFALESSAGSAVPHALLVLALHLKLVTQQHYLACVRGDQALDPSFVRLLREHWVLECGGARSCNSLVEIQAKLAGILPGRIPSTLRDYKRMILAIEDVLERQGALDVETLEDARGAALGSGGMRKAILALEVGSHRKTFLTMGIVNAAFVYAMRSLGPTAPAMLAGVVVSLSSRD